MTAGDFLRPHVDHALHPVTGKTRLSNLLLYLTDCEGGELRLIGPDTEFKIKPKANRAVLFQSYGNAVHAVEPVISGERIALSVYFYSDAVKPTRQNQKADFL
jgi:Rps23 Pro-64 3,4-dihydroxylase Tpa1-like proline 4-hydroxylase